MAEKGGKKAQGGRIEEQATELVRPIVEEAGYKLWDVCFEKEGAMWYLRILFDRDGGVDSDECEKLTEPINKLVDGQEFIKYVDILEVGSPGLTKKLRKPEHFESSVGTKIRVTVRNEKGKEEAVYGILEEYDRDKDRITLDGGRTFIAGKCVKVNADIE